VLSNGDWFIRGLAVIMHELRHVDQFVALMQAGYVGSTLDTMWRAEMLDPGLHRANEIDADNFARGNFFTVASDVAQALRPTTDNACLSSLQ
jgi:hypothetical protein